MKNTSKYYPLFILSLVIFLCVSQNTKGQHFNKSGVSVVVLDKQSREGISNVNIVVNSSSKGAATQKNGYARLQIAAFPATLSVSHVSYFGKNVTINTASDDTLTILLEPRINLLDEVSVLSEATVKLLPNYFFAIDFELCNKLIFSVGYYDNMSGYHVVIMDEKLMKKAEIRLNDSIKALGLFRDCLNNCHVLTKNAAYQIVQNDTTWAICCEVELERFHDIMDHCLFKSGNFLFFEHITNQGYAHTFFGIDVEKKTRQYFIQKNQFGRYGKLMQSLQFNAKHPPLAMREDDAFKFESEFMYRPFRETIFHFSDTIFHFNCNEGSIDFYDDRSLEKKGGVKLNERLTSSIWNDELIIDNTNSKVYIEFKGRLHEINTLNGEMLAKNRLKIASKVRLDNGFIYYLVMINNPLGSYKTVVRERIR